MSGVKTKKEIKWQKVDNVKRKIIHITAALVICFFPYFLSLYDIILLSVLFALFFLVAKIFKFLPMISSVKRISLGEVFYPIGVLISALVFLPKNEIQAFRFGILVLGFSDALANICGGLFGRFKYKIISGAKTVEGSSAFFLSTFILFIIVRGKIDSVSVDFYLLSSLFLTLIEAIFFLGLDNLFLPVLSSYLFSLI